MRRISATKNSAGKTATTVNDEVERDYLAINIGYMWQQMRREPLYFWLLCAYILFEYVRPQSVYPVLDFLPWGKVLLLGTLAARFTTNEPRSMENPLTFVSVGFFFAALLSSCFAIYPSASFDRFAAFINWLILYMLFLWIVTTKFRLFIIIFVFMLCSFKMSQHGAKTWIMRGMTFEFYGISGGPGYFGNAADLGVQMLVFAPLAIGFVMGCWKYWGTLKKCFFILFPISAVMTVVATGERGTLLGLAVMGLVTVLAGKQKFRKLLLIGIIGFSVFHVMPTQFKARFETMGEDGTSKARLRYWKRGVEMYADFPVFGIGFNNWANYYATRYPGESLRVGHQEVAHSTPVTVLAEMGTVGFLFFYGIAFMTLMVNRRTIKYLRATTEPPIWRLLAFTLSIGLFGFLAASCFVTEHEFPFLFVHSAISAAMYNIFVPNQKTLKRARA